MTPVEALTARLRDRLNGTSKAQLADEGATGFAGALAELLVDDAVAVFVEVLDAEAGRYPSTDDDLLVRWYLDGHRAALDGVRRRLGLEADPSAGYTD